ncbi:MAG: M24 family metallopeptidase, partial [Dehalococcoidia bacterium]|nr:M24 family metallopeptidase [Dehalococcoidia bacterium]
RGFPICLGEPPEPSRTLFDTTLEIALEVAAALRPGGRSSDVIAIGDRVPERGLWCHGPLASGLTSGGWQMLCVRGFDAYRPPTELTFEPGMVFTAFPHLMTPDNTKVVIIGNSVLITDSGPRILGAQGMRYVVK